MYINDEKEIIVSLRDLFDRIIKCEGNNVNIAFGKVEQMLDFILRNFMLLDENLVIISDIDRRNLFYRRLNWFYSKILLITVHDEGCRHTSSIRQLLKKMMQRSLNYFNYWFRSFVSMQLDMLKKAIVHDLSKNDTLEINIPGSEIAGNLNFSKIVIKTEAQMDNFISFLFQSLSTAIEVFPTCMKSADFSLSEIVNLVFINRNLECKSSLLLFCERYYKNIPSLEFVDVCVKVIHHVAIIYDNLNEYVESGLIYLQYFIQIFLHSFHKILEMLNNFFKSSNIKITDPATEDLLIASLIEIVYFESRWIKKYSVPTLTHWYTEIFDYVLLSIDYDEKLIKHIDIIKPLMSRNSNVLNILKFKIILELESAISFERKVSKISNTWLEIQNELALKTNYLLNNQQLPNDEFIEYLMWIKDAINITFDTNFHFTRRHQKTHCLQYICKYSECKKLDNPNSLFTFNDWDYDHIDLDFLDDLPSITHKLTLTVSKRKEFTVEICIILIELYSLILRIPSTSQIKDDKKLHMLATVILPFVVSFEKHDYMKAAEYIKIQSHLNVKMKNLIVEVAKDESLLDKMKRETIDGITRMKFSMLGKSFEWLNFNLMQLIFKRETRNIQKMYVSKFINLLMTNYENMSTFILHYQNIRLSNTSLELDELRDILCLNDKNVIILRTILSDYYIFCGSCDQENYKDKETRRRDYMKDKIVCIISADYIDKKEVNVNLIPTVSRDQVPSFYAAFIKNIPACIKHSKKFINFCQTDEFLDIIFKRNELILAQTDHYFQSIIKCIQQSQLDEECKTALMHKILNRLLDLTTYHASRSNEMNIQHHIVNMIITFGTNVRSNIRTYGNGYIPDIESVSLKCLKLLMYFIILKQSEVKGLAVNSMFRMLEYNGMVLTTFINWHKTDLLEHITKLCLLNSVEDTNQSSFLNYLINTLKQFSFHDFLKFLKMNMDVIITSIFVYCVHNNRMYNVYCFIDQCGYTVGQALEISCLTLYEKIYKLDNRRKLNCLNVIEKELKVTFKELFQQNRKNILQEVLVKYSQNPLFVIDVIKMLGDENLNLSDDENIANYISNRFLGVLNNFERILNQCDSEKALKQAVLQSLGELIRFLGGRRISNLCFKIMSLLRTSVATNHAKLKEISLSVWKILIFNCDIKSLGPFLSQIIVALEIYYKDHQAVVDEICYYMVFENSSLLSTHISDLFFIEKTSFDDPIKNAVLNQIASQRLGDGNEFETNLGLMIKHLKNEHADSNVKIYCLQYLEEFIKRNRKKINDLIFEPNGMDESIKYLLDVLTTCSKSLHNKKLLIQTAKCFGEFGAVKPALKKQNFLSKKIEKGEMSIHSDDFALKLLTTYCSYYKDMKETRHMESLALGIQAILQERKVNENHKIWKALPEFTRELFKPLLTSYYCPKAFNASKTESIFWNQAQTPTYWAYLLSGLLIEAIDVEETQTLLFKLHPSMRENQEISSILLPRIILHYFQSNTSKEFDNSIYDEFEQVFKMVLDNTIYSDASKDELNYKFVASYDYTPIKRKESEEKQNKVLTVSVKTAKMIFDVWDFLNRYIQITDNEELTSRIMSLFNRFSKKRLAEVNYKCGEYARAMILFESHIKTLNRNDRESDLPFLVNIYAKLRDADLIEGVKALRLTEWSFSDRIFISEITGNLDGTFSYIEMMMKNSTFTQEQIQTIINCYIQSNQNSTALLVADQLLEKLYDSNREHPYCNEVKAEALWRLSKFDELDELLDSEKISDCNNWNVICGKLLTKFRHEDTSDFWTVLEDARKSVMHNFKISDSEEAIYEDNYNEIFHLHVLCEFEKFQITFEEVKASLTFAGKFRALKNLLRELDSRKTLLQTTTGVIESSLSLRRCLLLQMKSKLVKFFQDEEFGQVSKFIDDEIGKTWIECARITCKQKMFAQAHAFMMEADVYQSPELFIEKAKYHWMRDDKASALRILELSCSELEKQCKSNKKLVDKKILLSRGRLYIARFNAEVKNVDFNVNRQLFKSALLDDSIDVQCLQNEQTYLLLAEYIDRHYFSQCSNSSDSSLPSYKKLLEIIEAYGSSMKYGLTYVLQSMPRFLQLWFDAMTSLERKPSKLKTRDDEEVESQINHYVKSIVKELKPYYFYTAFSQLISRLCHPSYSVYMILKQIITKLIEEYPLESMWFIMPNASSKLEFRKKRTLEILNSFVKEKTRFKNFNLVMEKIMLLAQKSKVDDAFMTEYCSSMEKLCKNASILMPLQKHLQMIQASTVSSTLSFSNSQVLIHRIDKHVEVMRSLQKPKKITFIGSDGKEYPMLLKFKDDLRIDFRYMEVLKVINDYFNKDADASQRCLSARTYSVIPWNEDMGIIEWVPNLSTFKSVVNDQYKKSNIKVPSNEDMRRLGDKWMTTDAQNKGKFFNDMKLRFPPILGQWYLQHFPNVQSYFNARQNYIRSMAVNSIVGYIMGLGDRHMENILFDIHSGEVVHVDFACVFHKGEKLGYPETVPFRLTQTMIEAMGPLGIEGPFKKCCEVTLQLMQKEKDTLISYLRPFIYDPMIRNKKSMTEQVENVDSEAMGNLQSVEKKLKGVVKKFKGTSELALSSEGQVKFIIDEATSDDNLAVMWFHWNPYI